jgi:hypothetical protein
LKTVVLRRQSHAEPEPKADAEAKMSIPRRYRDLIKQGSGRVLLAPGCRQAALTASGLVQGLGAVI